MCQCISPSSACVSLFVACKFIQSWLDMYFRPFARTFVRWFDPLLPSSSSPLQLIDHHMHIHPILHMLLLCWIQLLNELLNFKSRTRIGFWVIELRKAEMTLQVVEQIHELLSTSATTGHSFCIMHEDWDLSRRRRDTKYTKGIFLKALDLVLYSLFLDNR